MQLKKFNWGGNGATLSRLKRSRIYLPINSDGNPDYEYMENCIKAIEKKKLGTYKNHILKHVRELEEELKTMLPLVPLKEKEWKEFTFSDLFEIKRGYYNRKPNRTNKGDIPFIGATQFNNGITSFYTQKELEEAPKNSSHKNEPLSKKVFKGNCITVNNNGAVGYAFYHPYDFTCSSDVNVLYLKCHMLNRHIALFLIVEIEKQGVKFDYGLKWQPSRMAKTKLLLPVNDQGEPDYEYMENYIKRTELKLLRNYIQAKGLISSKNSDTNSRNYHKSMELGL